MPTTSLNPLQPVTQSSSLSTRFVRTSSASGAQGFAQIMQAFAPGAGSSMAESIKESQHDSRADQLEADEAADKKSISDQVDDAESKSDSHADGESSDTQGSGTEGQSDASGLDTSAQNDSETSESIDTNNLDSQATKNGASTGQNGDQGQVAGQQAFAGDDPAQEATFRLLENQSDQAKLTIKGVVLGLTHAADANVTAQAVQTRIGAEINGQVKSNQSPPVVPQPSQSTPQEVFYDGQANQESARQFGQPADAGKIEALNISKDMSSIDQRRIVSQVADQSTTDAQHSRGQRSETAIAVSASQPSASSTLRSAEVSQQAPSQLIEIGRSNTAQTTRGVARVEAGLIGSQPRETLPGSLAEKVKSTQLPDQTKRAHVLAQVQRGLASMLRSGKNDMTLKLTPGHLGEIRIQLKSDGDQLNVRFETSSQEAKEHLSESVKELGVNLRAKGISLDKIEIEQALTPESSKDDSSDIAGTNADEQSDSSASHQNDQDASAQNDQNPSDDVIDQDGETDEPESIWTDIGLDALA